MAPRARRQARPRHRPGATATVVLATLVAAAATTGTAHAAGLRLALVGTEAGNAAPLADAIASLHAATAPRASGATAIIDQRNATFVPGVIGIETGTRVTFPNSDNTLHHVYSFSPAKTFELPLYSGRRADPVLFDKPGVVTLGCNIHDWMVAHVVVLDTPWHAQSGADGRVRLEAPPGEYELRIWHERATAPHTQRVTLAGEGDPRTIRIPLAPAHPLPTAGAGQSRLRALQQRLRTPPREPEP
ncbi:MAG TPA: methylamine utilization protein [Xanthomonadaceae bacterium]|nr:methylamine utilization protein [Xanthomonadaceae bacterium]